MRVGHTRHVRDASDQRCSIIHRARAHRRDDVSRLQMAIERRARQHLEHHGTLTCVVEWREQRRIPHDAQHRNECQRNVVMGSSAVDLREDSLSRDQRAAPPDAKHVAKRERISYVCVCGEGERDLELADGGEVVDALGDVDVGSRIDGHDEGTERRDRLALTTASHRIASHCISPQT